ncbi:MAG: 3-hydroxyacyl-CoA dehydrogenase family protein [Pseudomonadota bacterium]
MSISKVFILGGGTMGRGIAQVCAQSGISVVLSDAVEEALKQSEKQIAWSVGKFIEKGKLGESLDQVMSRISFSPTLDQAAEAEMVIEVVYEDIEVKRQVLEKISRAASPEAIVASNTSAIPITDLAAFVENPERVLGLHFFNPVPMMAAVEVIKGKRTTPEILEAGREFILQIGKDPIMVRRDCPGFVINRINLPSSIEAMRVVEEGVASVEDIDKGVKLALGRRMGIFETGDIVGLDVTLGALSSIYQETKEPRWHPPMILRRKVKAGQLGRKTGTGWYRYGEDGKMLGPAED